MVEFLVIGGIGLAVLVVALVVGDVLDLGGPLGGLLESDVFSIASLSAFTGAFGFGGAIAQELSSTLWVSIPVGVVMGLLFSWFTVWFTRKLKNSRTDANVNTSALVGHEALVLTAIPEGGYGQVRLRVAGHQLTYSAKAPVAIDGGTRVWITNVLSATAVEVRPTDALGAADDTDQPTT